MHVVQEKSLLFIVYIYFIFFAPNSLNSWPFVSAEARLDNIFLFSTHFLFFPSPPVYMLTERILLDGESEPTK